MNILVTGGAGYIGAELVYKLSQCEDVSKIVVYDNLTRENYNLFISHSHKINNNKVKFELGDILDSRKLRKVLKDIDVAYHLAARVDTPYSNVDSHVFEQVNNWGTAELVYAVEESKVSKFIYLSSASVYGSSKKLVDENTAPNPRTFYSISKMRGEEHARRLMKKMETVIVRCGNVYGYTPTLSFDSVVNKFMFDANFTNRISIHGSGKQSRSFINVMKVVDGLIALRNKQVRSDVYNLIDFNYEILDIVDLMKEIFPDLEFLFINQHLELRELKLNPETRFNEIYKIPKTDFKEELIKFKERFAFNPYASVPVN
ncbi:MAG: NAD-dependent epimerase/dehydratase family protein [Cytophagaceae bacterium]|nr:NAD-dependent epimerase/dehydratase family protein [Cytophagaceae bacterium]